MSEQFENSAGAGVEPKGRRPRATAIWSFLPFFVAFLEKIFFGVGLKVF